MKTLVTKMQSLSILIKNMGKPLFALTFSGVMNEYNLQDNFEGMAVIVFSSMKCTLS